MMRPPLVLVCVMAAVLASIASAQTTVSEPSGPKTLAATMNVHMFPAEGQSADQHSKDEAEYYNWAVANTGTDPFDLAKQVKECMVRF